MKYVVFSLIFAFAGIITVGVLASPALGLLYIYGPSASFIFGLYTVIGFSLFFSQTLIRGKIDVPEGVEDVDWSVALTASMSFYMFLTTIGATIGTIAYSTNTSQVALIVALAYGVIDYELAEQFNVSPATLLAVFALGLGLLVGWIADIDPEIEPRDIPAVTWSRLQRNRINSTRV